MNLFVYGTLKDRELIQSLLMRTLGEPCMSIMPDCATVTSKWGYPVMIADANSRVEGIVWRGLTVQDFTILDRYEGCHVETSVYQREKRNVTIEGKTEEVWAYFGTPLFLTHMR